MNFTHEKRPYKATCTQFNGNNHDEIIALLNDENTYAAKYGTDCIMVRFSKPSQGQRAIETITAGWWVVIGENKMTKCYDDYTFRVKYKRIGPEVDDE